MTGLVVDNFAGGGGASTGIEQALGRAVDIAINHDEEAIRMHEANHPGTRHIRNNIWLVDPADVTEGKLVELAWFSPDCKHFSKAKGGKPREKSIRDLAWVVVLWAKRVRPALILLENVEEFRTWGPLDEDGQIIRERAGETFDKWCRELRRAGYKLQFRELRACDYGAPTIRKRFFMIARRDGLPIVWPEPTHGAPDSKEVLAGKRLPWRTAAEIIDWSIPCPSIFERKKPLAEKTLRRIAHGIVKFVLDNPKPFIVPLTHHGSDGRSYSADAPLHTVTGAHRGELAIVSPSIVGCGGRRGQSPPVDITAPYPTTTAKADACLVAPIFARTAHGEVDKKGKKRGKGSHPATDPFPTISTSQDSALVMAHITKFRAGAIGHDITVPLATVTANSFVKRPGGCAPLGLVEARLVKFNKESDEWKRRSNTSLETRSSWRIQTRKASSSPAPNISLLSLPTWFAIGPVTAAKSRIGKAKALSPDNGRGGARAAAHLVHIGNGERQGQAPRAMDAARPLGTVVAGGIKHSVVQAFMQKFADNGRGYHPSEPLHTVMAGAPRHAVIAAHLEQANGSPEGEKPLAGRAATDPLSTIVAKGCTQRLVTSNLLKLRGKCAHGQSVEEPLATISAQGTHMAEVRAFLLKYYGNETEGHDPEKPLGTVTTKERFGLVTVSIDGEEYVIVDIGMRMLTPRELFNAQGFPPDYIIDHDAEGRPTTKTSQVARCGNSVCPPLSRALTDANAPSLVLARMAAAEEPEEAAA
jgi:DNA (cytosine-5)-methyltransferase 1